MSISYYNNMNVNYNMINEKICLKVKFERLKKGFSQEELALKANISRNTIWKIETGKASPTVETLAKIAQALEIEFSVLTDISKVDL